MVAALVAGAVAAISGVTSVQVTEEVFGDAEAEVSKLDSAGEE